MASCRRGDLVQLWEENCLALVSMLDSVGLIHFAALCCSSRRRAAEEWNTWECKLRCLGLAELEEQLRQVWRRHGALILGKGRRLNAIDSAYDLYCCWPSTSWFGEAKLPVRDHLDFEFGDSSYNVWIFDIQAALPLLGRLACDLYSRMEWPSARSPRAESWSEADGEEKFVELALAAARETDKSECWEFKMRPVGELMEQIWWRSNRPEMLLSSRGCPSGFEAVVQNRPFLREGFLLPRKPEPKEGLSLRWGQESVFMTWDRFELWVYGCYVD